MEMSLLFFNGMSRAVGKIESRFWTYMSEMFIKQSSQTKELTIYKSAAQERGLS